MIERLCKGLKQLASPSGAGFVAIWLGIEVENGADPGRSVEAVLQCFFRWSQRVGTTAGDGTADAEIVAGLRLLGQSLITHISRMPDLRSQLAGSPEILTELGRIEHHSSGAAWFLRLLSQRSGKLLLINVLGRYGFHIRYQNLANCFHLFTLLQGELAKILHGTPPARPLPRDLALGKCESRRQDTAWWHYGHGHTPWPDVTASVWGELNPDSIDRIDAQQVLLLWPPIFEKSWSTDCFQPFLAQSPPDVTILRPLSSIELDNWWNRLNLPEQTGRGSIMRNPWWKFWKNGGASLPGGKGSKTDGC